MQNYLLLLVSFLIMTAVPMSLQAQLVNPPNYPDNAAGGKYFDWQAEWGTIHMNSFADKLVDPGTPVSKTGEVECPQGEFCTSRVNTSLDQTGRTPFKDKIGTITKTPLVENGIKYDIKNSILNCMSKKVPNWSYRNNSSYTSTYVCIGNLSMPSPSQNAYGQY